jgi:hypothetical protein
MHHPKLFPTQSRQRKSTKYIHNDVKEIVFEGWIWELKKKKKTSQCHKLGLGCTAIRTSNMRNSIWNLSVHIGGHIV